VLLFEHPDASGVSGFLCWLKIIYLIDFNVNLYQELLFWRSQKNAYNNLTCTTKQQREAL